MNRTLLDRAIQAVAPVYAARRMKARAQLQLADALGIGAGMSVGDSAGEGAAMQASYASADPTNSWAQRWVVQSRSAAADTVARLPTLRAQSRDLARNHPIAASAINTNVVRAVGTGLAYSAQPHRATLGWSEAQALEWRSLVQAEFSLWADSAECDIRSQLNFYDLQDLVLRAMLESGDCFTLMPDGARTPSMPYRLRLQVLEADRIGNPKGQADTASITAGIRRGPGGAPEAYHVYASHPGSHVMAGGDRYAGQWVDAVGRSGRRGILHHYKTLRPEQPRGMPYLAPVMQLFKDLGTYTDAEVKAAVVSAFLTVFIETEAGTGPAPVFGAGAAAAAAGTTDLTLGPAAILGLLPGEKANISNPGRPNPAFGPFVEAVITQLGAGLFIGPEMLMKRYNTSYVAARAAFLDAWKHLLDMRTRIVRSLCQPVLETWMAEAVAIGRVPAPGFFQDPRLRWAYTRAHWAGDSQGSINPKDEVAAYIAAVDGRLLTRERAEWELFGSDWRDTYDAKKAEHDRLAADGLLPVPKAGAAAPAQGPAPTNPARDDA